MGDLVFNGGMIVEIYMVAFIQWNSRQIRYLGWKSTVTMILNISYIDSSCLHVIIFFFKIHCQKYHNQQCPNRCL